MIETQYINKYILAKKNNKCYISIINVTYNFKKKEKYKR